MYAAAGQEAYPSPQDPSPPPKNNNGNRRVSFCLPVSSGNGRTRPLLPLLATPCQPSPSTDRCESPCCSATLLFQTPTPKRARTQQVEESASETSDAIGDATMEIPTVDELLDQAGRKKAEIRGGQRGLKRARGPYINAAKVAKIKLDIGNFNLEALHQMKKPDLRRHVDAKRK